MRGIEPPYVAWEATVLPLNYTREDFRVSIVDPRFASSERAGAKIMSTPPAQLLGKRAFRAIGIIL